MPAAEQNLNDKRYHIIPRVLVFTFRADQVLLIELLPKNGKLTRWTGKLNGPGGHVEQGEDLLSTARRELLEETGLTADLSLVGTIMVNASPGLGIGLFVFKGINPRGELCGSPEGSPHWIGLDELERLPVVDDVVLILEAIRKMEPGDGPFSGHSYYNEAGDLVVVLE
jgi:8-oxo-dGTP diphosphatase